MILQSSLRQEACAINGRYRLVMFHIVKRATPESIKRPLTLTTYLKFPFTSGMPDHVKPLCARKATVERRGLMVLSHQ